jgi:uncharacterized protein (TIGR02996 family)
MSQEQAILAALLASPDDLELRQVFADWLQEQGDLRGELLRLPIPGERLGSDRQARGVSTSATTTAPRVFDWRVGLPTPD